MNTGGFAQMANNGFPSSGLASRRGGQNIKPLSFEALKPSTEGRDNGSATPRTSRSHLLAGLRTAPKSATVAMFPASPTSTGPSATQQMHGRNGIASNMYGGHDNLYNGPKTSMPRMGSQQPPSFLNSNNTNNNNNTNSHNSMNSHFTTEQILAPPEIHIDEQTQRQMDPSLYAQLVATNMYLAQQQQQLQQQLLNVQAGFQNLGINGSQMPMQQQLALQTLYQQQQQLKHLQQQMASSMPAQQQNVYAYYDPATGQQYIVDQNTAQQMNSLYNEQQPSTPQTSSFGYQQQNNSTPRVQVSPPPAENQQPSYRSNSPPKRPEFTAEPTPLPPPSANAFRRGHKKASSLAGLKPGLFVATEDGGPKSAGPKSAVFPLSPMPNGGYGPGQARAGEHPIRQPRGPPALDELRSKPTAKHEGSKNFAARTRRSAVHNLVRAGLERRKGTTSSNGSMSPVSESAEEVETPLTDNDSDSGRSGSGSLSGDAEPSLASSRTSASGAWGAIGSDRPSSRQKSRKSVDSLSSACESDNNSFASIIKKVGGGSPEAAAEGPQRKAPMFVLTSAEKRKGGVAI